MPAYNFKAQFADKVERFEKRQTIRPRRKRPTRVGDTLRLYTGQRTAKCRLLGEAVVTEVVPFTIYNSAVMAEQYPHCWFIRNGNALEKLACDDGFDSVAAFFKFFRDTYGLSEDKPLTDMELIKWEPCKRIKLSL